METKKIGLKILLIFVIIISHILMILSVSYIHTDIEERAHGEVFRLFGCNERVMEVNLFKDSYCSCIDPNFEVTDEVRSLTAQVDIQFYSIKSIILALFSISLFHSLKEIGRR